MEFLKSGRIRLVQVPVQSGSNRVLGLMNRPYAIEDVRECVARINADFPRVLLDTHFIVGHPGERESDFQESLKIIRDLKFDKITGFAFEPKENTLSIAMPEQVSPHVKKKRIRQLWNTALRAHVRRAAKI
jgi:tRNA-2-methylthio-N6-dimethylallyladenosine synthase